MKKKFVQRIFSVLLSVLLVLPVFALVPATAADTTVISSADLTATVGYDATKVSAVPADADTYPDIAGGLVDGATAYKLTNAAGLQKMSDLVNAGTTTFAGVTIHMLNDIDMSGVVDFMPIGFNKPTTFDSTQVKTAPTYYFAGAFQGHGYIIENLKIDVNNTTGYGNVVDVGLFGVLYDGALVRDLIFGKNCEVKYSGDTSLFTNTSNADLRIYVGALAGRNYQTSTTVTVENIYSKATVTAARGSAGGIIGASYAVAAANNTIINCTNNATVTGWKYSGGILGLAGGMVTIKTSRNIGNVIGKTGADVNAGIGGIVGGIQAWVTLDACINDGVVEASHKGMSGAISGIAGIVRSGATVYFSSNCYHYGEVKYRSDATATPQTNEWIYKQNGSIYLNGKQITDGSHNNYVTEGEDPTFKQMLDTQVQLTEGTTAVSGTTNLRFVTSIDTLNYQNVGFKVTLTAENGTTANASHVIKTVYKTITGKGETYNPYTEFDPTSRYFATFVLEEITADYFGMTISGYAYATDMDGNEIKGDEFSFTISELISAN